MFAARDNRNDPNPPGKKPPREEQEPVVRNIDEEETFDAVSAQGEIEKASAERDEWREKYIRTLADYQNSQKRHAGNEQEARQQGRTGVILNVLPVLDHFDLALAQDPARLTADSVVTGVKVIRDELMKVLQTQGVGIIEPAPNSEFDPTRHQAVVQMDEAHGVEPGRVIATLQRGYTLGGGGGGGDRVIRPAVVSVRRKPEA